MLPIPPLDGGRVALGILPPPLALPFARLERFGIFIVLGLFVVGPHLGLNVAEPLLHAPARMVLDVIVTVAALR
jgi:Zn-dependent protease